MALTKFGREIRKARLDTEQTLGSMADALQLSPAFLSGIETGRKKIPAKVVQQIRDFFDKLDHKIDNLEELADVANQTVQLDGISPQQQMLVAGFARSPLDPEQLRMFAELLKSQKGSGNV